jgi:hypothetical protein
VPVGKLAPMLNVPDTEGVLQLSVAVGVAHCPIAVAAVVVTVILAGQVVKTGLTVSLEQGVMMRFRVTVNEHVLLLFFESEAVYVTVVVPILNNELGCFVAVIVVILQLSIAVGAFQVRTSAVSGVSFKILAGQL